jgi:hypothetical protein
MDNDSKYTNATQRCPVNDLHVIDPGLIIYGLISIAAIEQADI